MFRSKVLSPSSDRKVNQVGIKKSVLLQKNYLEGSSEIRSSHGGEWDVTPCIVIQTFQRKVLLPSLGFNLKIEAVDYSGMLVTFYQNRV
jgi:hypothetical protein